jgi:hypothetical protein
MKLAEVGVFSPFYGIDSPVYVFFSGSGFFWWFFMLGFG